MIFCFSFSSVSVFSLHIGDSIFSVLFSFKFFISFLTLSIVSFSFSSLTSIDLSIIFSSFSLFSIVSCIKPLFNPKLLLFSELIFFALTIFIELLFFSSLLFSLISSFTLTFIILIPTCFFIFTSSIFLSFSSFSIELTPLFSIFLSDMGFSLIFFVCIIFILSLKIGLLILELILLSFSFS